VTNAKAQVAPPRRVLLVEDEYLLADDLRREIEAAGALVLGPVATVGEALRLLDGPDRPDAAVLDVNLGGDSVFPVARALRRLGVPFVFLTGFDPWALPRDFADVPHHEKPVDARQVLRALGLMQPPAALRA
jgi:CheY-like chemotaxis protein